MKEIGDHAEQTAVDFLKDRGLKIIERNWQAGGGEIDIIARYKKSIHFVEVKFRRSGLDDTWQAVDVRKQQRLSRTAKQWMLEYGRAKWSYQFDVIGVSGQDIAWRQHVIEQ